MPYFMHQWVYKDVEMRKMATCVRNRAEIVRVATRAFGGALHSFFFTFGEYDGISITEFPDKETAMACLMSVVGQGGLMRVRTTVLLTPEEGQEAMQKAHAVLMSRSADEEGTP
jgi:uncharacterized protein with GYD domain